jgi:iron complex outermembrane receptor protein
MRPRRLSSGPRILLRTDEGERLFRRGWVPDNNGRRRAAGALSRRFRAVVLGPLCFAVALPFLACATANAASDDQMSELTQATQNNPPKSDTARETPEQAQPPTTKQKANTGVLEEVIVTGSRIPLAAQERAQDVKIFTRADIDRSGQTTLTDFLDTISDVSVASTENLFQNVVGGTSVTLHGLPVGTTLVLINGRRVESSPAQARGGSGNVFFDLNNIPFAAVERVEIVSEGSSAVYGSDAIGGVVNIVLNDNFDGLDTRLGYGGAEGTRDASASVLWGRKFESGSLSAIATYQDRTALNGFDRGEILRGADPGGSMNFSNFYRYSCSQGNVLFPNGFSFDGGKTSVSYAAVPAGLTGIATVGDFAATAGTLNSCTTRTPYSYGDLIPATNRAGLYVAGHLAVADSTELFTELLYSHVKQTQQFFPSLSLLGDPIDGIAVYKVGATNPYNPFGETVGVAMVDPSAGIAHYQLATDFGRGVLGARGTIAAWEWETAALLSGESSQYDLFGGPNSTLARAALNSSDPATALNPFVNVPSGSPALLHSLVYADQAEHYRGQTADVTAFVRGQIPGADRIKIVVGGEYEHDLVAWNNISVQSTPPGGPEFTRSIVAGFAEAHIAFAETHAEGGIREVLGAIVAGRYDHYSGFGGKFTPQYGVELRPTNTLLIRATYSDAFKAPSLYTLYAPQRVTPDTLLFDPLHGDKPVMATLITGGNPDARPELGLSRTLGLVYSSQFIPGFRAAFTYWSIDETDSIQTLGANVLLQNEASFPALIVRDAAGNLVSVDATATNFGNIHVKGVDGELSYKSATRMGEFGAVIRATDTYQYTSALIPGAPPLNGTSVAQDTGQWAPRLKGGIVATWEQRALSVAVSGRYTGRYQDYDSAREIGDFWLFDVSATLNVNRAFDVKSSQPRDSYVKIGAVNAFNRLPQNSNFDFGTVGYDPTQSDIRGRFVYAQLGVRW